MQTKINVIFKKINGINVDEKLLEKEPKLLDATKKTVKILCIQIEKYFNDNHIKVITNFELEK